MVLMGYHYEIQLSHIFDIPSIVHEKPSASNKKKIVYQSKFGDFEHFQNIVF